jgi:hypothetical protein
LALFAWCRNHTVATAGSEQPAVQKSCLGKGVVLKAIGGDFVEGLLRVRAGCADQPVEEREGAAPDGESNGEVDRLASGKTHCSGFEHARAVVGGGA